MRILLHFDLAYPIYFHKPEFQMNNTSRMKQFLVNSLGGGDHRLQIHSDDCPPTEVRVEDHGWYERERSFDVQVSDPSTENNISLSQVCDHVVRTTEFRKRYGLPETFNPFRCDYLDLIRKDSVVQGDCIETIPRLYPTSINLALCSPPYAEQRKNDYPSIPEKDYPDWMVEIMSELWDKLADDGSVIINIRPHLRKGVISDYVLKTRLALRERGWQECEELIWHKPDGGACMGSMQRPRRTYEQLLWFSKNGKPFIDTKACGHDSSNLSLSSHHRSSADSAKAKDGKGAGRTRVTDLFTVPVGGTARGMGHPAMMPITLAEQLIQTFSREGDTVLDFCAGSGTTCIAAANTGRSYIGIETLPKYVGLANERLQELMGEIVLP
jgi:DNA modification methylase